MCEGAPGTINAVNTQDLCGVVVEGINKSGGGPGRSPAVKDAQVGMSRGMVRDLGQHNINCKVAVAGPFYSHHAGGSGELALPELPDAIPMGRRGVPQDMAGAIGFLVGPFRRYTSGQALHPNGGIHR